MILANVSWAYGEAAGERMQQNIAALEVLVNNGNVTIRREDREQLDQPESRWSIKDPARVAYYRKL